MKHIIFQTDDVPVHPVLMDRRRIPDRRTQWRGGRRDADWHNRPLGAWTRVGPREDQLPRWARLFSALHVW